MPRCATTSARTPATDAHGYGQLSRFLSPAVVAEMDELHELDPPGAGERTTPEPGEPRAGGQADVDGLLTSLLA